MNTRRIEGRASEKDLPSISQFHDTGSCLERVLLRRFLSGWAVRFADDLPYVNAHTDLQGLGDIESGQSLLKSQCTRKRIGSVMKGGEETGIGFIDPVAVASLQAFPEKRIVPSDGLADGGTVYPALQIGLIHKVGQEQDPGGLR